MSTAQRALRSVGLNAIRMFVTAVSSFLVSVVTARSLGAHEMGTYTYLLWVSATVVGISSLGLPDTVARYVAEHRGTGDLATSRRIARLFVFTQIAASAVATTIAVGIWRLFSPSQSILIICLALATVVPSSMQQLLIALLEGEERFDLQLFAAAFGAALQLLFAIACAVQHASLLGFIAANLAASALASFATLLICRPMLRVQGGEPTVPIGELAIRMRSFSLAVYALFLLNIVVWDKSELFFLRNFRSSAEVAFYSLAFAITCRLASAVDAVAGVSFPIFVQRFTNEGAQGLAPVYAVCMRYVQAIMVPLCLWTIPLTPQLVSLAYGKQYSGVSIVMQVLLGALAFTAVVNVGVSAIYSMERQHFYLRYLIAIAVVNILLDLALIPRFGAVGAAFANGLAQIVGAAGLFLKLRRLLPGSYSLCTAAKIYVAALLSATPLSYSTRHHAGLPLLLCTLIISAAIYAVLLFKWNVVAAADYARLRHSASSLFFREKEAVRV